MIDQCFDGLLPFDEIATFRDALSRPAPRCVRLRPDRMDSVPVSASMDVVPWFDRGRLFRDSNMRPSQSIRYAAADYYIQDAGSLLALALLDAKPGETICDLCAAPGGKASGIGESLGERGFLLANEPIGSRAAILRYALSRTGNLRHAITQQDPEQIAERFAGLFDAVLVDAPCSGQSMVGRGKRNVNAFDPKQVDHSARRQQRILLAALRLLKPEGRLIYSTCTFSVEENESQIQYLRNQFRDALEPIHAPSLEKWASPLESGCYRLWPHRDPTTGAFVAGLKLRDSIAHFDPIRTRKSESRSRPQRPCRSANERNRIRVDAIEGLGAFGQLSRIQICGSDRGEAFGLPDDAPEEIHRGLELREWPKLGVCRSGVWKPEYTLAMLGSDWFEPKLRFEADAQQAKKYLLGEAISIDIPTFKNEISDNVRHLESPECPWAVVIWQQRSLGWAKYAENRVNNHLPALATLPIHNSEEFSP